VVVPTNIESGDTLVLADGRVGEVTAVHADSIVIRISGVETTIPAVYEGEI
jgi:preprotein translocase subunit YajC